MAVQGTPDAPIELGQDDGPAVLWEQGDALPKFLRLDGVSLVLLTAKEYGELVTLRLQQAVAPARIKRPPPRVSTIEHDAEVGAYLRDLFRGRMTIRAIREACLAQFGAERTPSSSRIQTFRQRVRG